MLLSVLLGNANAQLDKDFDFIRYIFNEINNILTIFYKEMQMLNLINILSSKDILTI